MQSLKHACTLVVMLDTRPANSDKSAVVPPLDDDGDDEEEEEPLDDEEPPLAGAP